MEVASTSKPSLKKGKKKTFKKKKKTTQPLQWVAVWGQIKYTLLNNAVDIHKCLKEFSTLEIFFLIKSWS